MSVREIAPLPHGGEGGGDCLRAPMRPPRDAAWSGWSAFLRWLLQMAIPYLILLHVGWLLPQMDESTDRALGGFHRKLQTERGDLSHYTTALVDLLP